MTVEQKIPVGTTGKNLRSFEQTTTAGVVQVEAISIVDSTNTSAIAPVTNASPGVNDYGLNVRVVSAPLPTNAAQETGGNLAALATHQTDGTQITQVSNFPATQAISAVALPLPTGAATAANQTNVESAPGTPQTTAITVQGNASGVAVPISASALPLPTGAATSALQTTGNTSLSSIDGKTATLGQKTMAGSSPVVIASDQSAIPISIAGSSTGTATSVAGTTTPGTSLLAANTARQGYSIFNDDTLSTGATLYLANFAGATTSSYTLQVAPGGYYEVPFAYRGAVTGVWSAATGHARITEYT